MRVGQTAVKYSSTPNHSYPTQTPTDEQNWTVTSSTSLFSCGKAGYTERLQMATRYVDGLIAFAYFATVFFGTMYVKGPKLFKRRSK